MHWPRQQHRDASRGVRVDHALESGQVVSTSYDPMLGKVIAWGRDREDARAALLEALDDTAVLGLTTNAGFLRQLVASDEFRDATIDTAWLDTAELPAPDPGTARMLAAHAVAESLRRTASGPFGSDSWRASAGAAPVTLRLDDEVVVHHVDGMSEIDGHRLRTLSCRELHDPPGGPGGAQRVEIDLDGSRHVLFLAHGPHRTEAVHRGQRFDLSAPDLLAGGGQAMAAGEVVAPMPGTVLVVDVRVGDRVIAGQPLGAIEAMKMELSLTAPFDGVVTGVGATVGDQVALGAPLFTVEAPGEPEE